MTPTPEQEAIMDSVKNNGHVMVNALAGTAKTTTIEMAIRTLPSKHQILVLAFNLKIKKEIEKRVKDLPNVKVQTANGFGLSALYRSGLRSTLDNDKIYKLSLATGLRKENLSDLMTLVRHGRMAGIWPDGMAGKGMLPDDEETWQALADDLEIESILTVPARTVLKESTSLALKGQLDFDDQIYLSALSFGSFPRYDTIFVDEAQDLSILNHAQIRRASKTAQLVAVGDPHQAIYAWRGADSNSMGHLRDLRDAWTDRTLSVTFRCPRAVVERQRDFIPHFTAGPDNREGHVGRLSNWTPERDSAILCRNNAPIFRTAFRLLRRGIPAQVLGSDVGKSLKRLYNKLSDHGRLPNEQVQEKARLIMDKEPKKVDQLESLIALLEGSNNVDRALDAIFSSQSNPVVLSTGHRAKGLEWPTVYHLEPQLIPSVHATTEAELQQENNLRYVIETRTKDNLFFVREGGLQ